MKPVSLSQAQQEILVDFSRPQLPPAPIILQCSDTQKFIRMSLVIIVEFPNLSHKYYYSRSDPTHAAESESERSFHTKYERQFPFVQRCYGESRVEIFCFADFSPLYFRVEISKKCLRPGNTPAFFQKKPLRCHTDHSAVHHPRCPLEI